MPTTVANLKAFTRAWIQKTFSNQQPSTEAMGADHIRKRLKIDGIEPVIPPINSRAKKLHYDKVRYRERNRVERFPTRAAKVS
jgi:hypothetical protein